MTIITQQLSFTSLNQTHQIPFHDPMYTTNTTIHYQSIILYK